MYYSEEDMEFLRSVFEERYLSVKQYEGLAHTVNSSEIHDVVTWIRRICDMSPSAA